MTAGIPQGVPFLFTIYDFLCNLCVKDKKSYHAKVREEVQRNAKKCLGLWIPDQVRNAFEDT